MRFGFRVCSLKQKDRLVTAALGALIAVAACSHKKPPPPPPPPPLVKVVTVRGQTVSLTTVLPGRTVAYRVAEARPQVSGVIQKRMFIEGSDVKVGQQLYLVDPALDQAAYESASTTAASPVVQVERL